MSNAIHSDAPRTLTPGSASLTHSRPTPRPAVYGFTFVNSLSAGLVTSGIFVLTAEGFGFSALQNFLLGVVLGVMYITGALGAQRFTRFLRRVIPGLNSRGILVCIMIALGALTTLPALVCGLGKPDRAAGGEWSVWVMIALYSPITGVLWPMVESFLSGGRRDKELRAAIGLWNVLWSGSLVIGAWAISRFVKDAPGAALVALGLLQVASIVILRWFPREPGVHVHETHAPTPPIYADLLTTFRVFLPASYVVSSALGPILPLACNAIGVPAEWQMVVASAWLLPRCLGFLALERWHGWHGRWSAPVVGGVLFAGGFALSIFAWSIAKRAPTEGLDGRALGILLLGLALFGVGMAIIYAGAIYYAMEVGAAEVEAGGMHEALIGVGYTGGPLLGVLAIGAQSQGIISENAVSTFILTGVLLVLLFASAVVIKRVRDGHRKYRPK
ncbi:MAG: hypothetical protein KF805_02330 [Phycisphaeraceae bacterium]|nr:hypothetical protein [Phycisphaeraceae bacterium]